MDSHRISSMADRYTQHDMIKKYADLPEFPHLRTTLLHAFLTEGGTESASVSDLHALVISLLQLGLDTHDEVENGHDATDPFRMRAKQLKVLAGDYFSGRFYSLLSRAEQIELVRKLSQAVCEVNRMKINMYMKMRQLKLTAEEYLQSNVEIRTRLFLGFTHLMHDVYKKQWPAVLRVFTRCELIAGELKNLDKAQERESSAAYVEQVEGDSWAYWYVLNQASPQERERLLTDSAPVTFVHTLSEKYGLRTKLLTLLEHQIHELSAEISHFRAQTIVDDLRRIVDKFRNMLPTRVVPEDVTR